ncbi:MAG: hypothetical protein JXA52_10330 [Planctomycetes bacterium]|nr:hypothetical protein [Planctomycetota bacterium]
MFNRRVLILTIIFLLAFLVLFTQMVSLQILEAEDWRERGEKRLHRREQIVPRRGSILDRNGRILAEDRATWDLWIVLGQTIRPPGEKPREEFILGEITVARMRNILRAHSAQQEREELLAVEYLRDHLPLTERLAEILWYTKSQEAASLLEMKELVAKALFREAKRSMEDPRSDGIFRKRHLFRNIGNAAYFRILQDQNMRGEDSLFEPLDLQGGWLREYPFGESAAHITGYVGPLSKPDYERLRGTWGEEGLIPGEGEIPGFFIPTETELDIIGYKEITKHGEMIPIPGFLQNEIVGKRGIERQYNQSLRGSHGRRYLHRTIQEPSGRKVWEVKNVEDPGRNGRSLMLTIDAEIQQQVYEKVQAGLEERHLRDQEEQQEKFGPQAVGREYNAACVLMDPNTGAIQALVSIPSYDPAEVRKNYSDYMLAKSRYPLLNRVTTGIYPPGSTFKPVVALAALNCGCITPETEYDCQGAIRLGNHDFICMRRVSHGLLKVEDALKYSCNVFFYNTGRDLGRQRLYDFICEMGFDQPTGIDLPSEKAGQMKDNLASGYRWSIGNTFHLSIGQEIAVTPIQMAVAVSAIANGGKIVRPHLLAGIEDATPEEMETLAVFNQPVKNLELTQTAIKTVRQGMWKVVNEEGTGRRCRIASLEICGKSGSADWKQDEPTHAWFVAYAPAEDPQVVAVIVVPEGNLGGRTCAPIIKDIMKVYFDLPDFDDGVG